MLKVHEFTTASGELSAVFLRCRGEELALVRTDGELPLPEGALRAVMERYGHPFDSGAKSLSAGSLVVAPGATLRHVRHLAGYDVIARDYLVYEQSDQVPLCAMATTIAAALEHLAQAQARACALVSAPARDFS